MHYTIFLKKSYIQNVQFSSYFEKNEYPSYPS